LPTRLDRYSTAAICHHVLLRHRRTGTVLLHHSLHQQASSQGQCVMNSFSRGPFLLWQAAGRKAGRQAGGCNVPGPRFTSAFGHLISSSAPPAHAAIATHSTGNRISLRPSQQLPPFPPRRKQGQISDLIVFYCDCACVLSSASSAPKTQRFRLVMRRSIPWMKRPP
jgi:hypothetical protein